MPMTIEPQYSVTRSTQAIQREDRNERGERVKDIVDTAEPARLEHTVTRSGEDVVCVDRHTRDADPLLQDL